LPGATVVGEPEPEDPPPHAEELIAAANKSRESAVKVAPR